MEKKTESRFPNGGSFKKKLSTVKLKLLIEGVLWDKMFIYDLHA